MDDGYYDLGGHSFAVTTSSPAAQTWFDRGLAWCYGFNHEEAIVCFENALAADPACAMAHWGLAYAVGPNYNKPWAEFDPVDLEASLERARGESVAAARFAEQATPVETALCQALLARYPAEDGERDYMGWHDAYAAAMRRVHGRHGDHADVCALFVEALMNRTPWALWDLETGTVPQGADTDEIVATIEAALRDVPGAGRHAGLLHMHVHVMEMSPYPERALKSGDALYEAMPDSGHLRHMPTHIDVLCGNYQAVVERNHAAVVADRKFVARSGVFNFYTGYRAHDFHFKAYGAMFLGQYGPAIEAAEELIATTPKALLERGSPPMADWLEGYIPIKQHVLIRFGKWQEILDQPLPEDAELYCVTTAMIRYTRTVAYAATGRVPEAEAEKVLFYEAVARMPESRKLFNNTCREILAVAEQMLLGELEYRKGNHDAAFAHLRRSVELDDHLPYDEPWGWMQPTRHALGALLLEQGRVDEAEAVYRADLGLDGTLRRPCQHPDNVWSLHGLHECLKRRGEKVECVWVKQRLDLAAARADVPIRASCYCRMQHAA
ncbi:MAG: tetratricopeptide repeat protein [Proteobacteria bacterium]|nr:tetratricopeptide repeat protein [Pseudomonadota bacterium]